MTTIRTTTTTTTTSSSSSSSSSSASSREAMKQVAYHVAKHQMNQLRSVGILVPQLAIALEKHLLITCLQQLQPSNNNHSLINITD
jgi:hypothetical protein